MMRKALYILSLLDDADIHWLVTTGVRQTLQPGAALIESGRPVNALYIVIDGEVAVTLGTGQVVAQLASGEVVGEISFLDSRPPLTSVTAVDEAMVFAIPRTELSDKLRRDDGFAARFYRAVGTFLALRLRETTASLGYAEGHVSEEELEDTDELPEDLMENVSLGGTRFTWILDQLRAS